MSPKKKDGETKKKGSTLGNIAREHGNPNLGDLMDEHARRTGKDQIDTSPQAGKGKRGPEPKDG